MYTRIIRVGNSYGIVLPKKLLRQYHLAGEVELCATPEGLLVVPIARPARRNWDAQIHVALIAGQAPEGELLEDFTDNDFEENEWQW